MQYDGDLLIPERYLVAPPQIVRTVGEYLAANGRRSFVVSETQKFGHVTYFFNGNRSGRIDETLERYVEVASDVIPFEQSPRMKAQAITQAAIDAIESGEWDHIRINLANGDMVGHTGDFDATVEAIECVDACVGRLEEAITAAGGVLIVTADHGNADQMYEIDKKTGDYRRTQDGSRLVRTAHSLNPVPCILLTPRGGWTLSPPAEAGLANLAATILNLLGLATPEDYLPGLVEPR